MGICRYYALQTPEADYLQEAGPCVTIIMSPHVGT
jgi:hypothetical protein